jgi:hypothetical protein
MATKHQRRPQKRLPSSFSRVRNYQETTATIAIMIMITNPGRNTTTEIGLRTVKDSVVHTTTIKMTTLMVEDPREVPREVIDHLEEEFTEEQLRLERDLSEVELR